MRKGIKIPKLSVRLCNNCGLIMVVQGDSQWLSCRRCRSKHLKFLCSTEENDITTGMMEECNTCKHRFRCITQRSRAYVYTPIYRNSEGVRRKIGQRSRPR